VPVNTGNAALFFDLGGTLVELDQNRDLPADSSGNIRIQLLPGVADKLAPIRNALIFIVTNQSGVARGRFTLEQIESAIAEVDRQLGGVLTGWRICPHRGDDGCECRKPKPSMVTDLAQTFGVELAASIFVGDQEMDRECSEAAGVGKFVFAKDFFGFNE